MDILYFPDVKNQRIHRYKYIVLQNCNSCTLFYIYAVFSYYNLFFANIYIIAFFLPCEATDIVRKGQRRLSEEIQSRCVSIYYDYYCGTRIVLFLTCKIGQRDKNSLSHHLNIQYLLKNEEYHYVAKSKNEIVMKSGINPLLNLFVR